MTARGVAVVELCAALHESGSGRYCCKSLFALVIKNSPGFDDKLTGDLDNVIEITQVGGSRSDRLTARKSSPGNFGLLQHNRHSSAVPTAPSNVGYQG